jgi:uncharacterized protein DUF6861/SH3 domain-containing protein
MAGDLAPQQAKQAQAVRQVPGAASAEPEPGEHRAADGALYGANLLEQLPSTAMQRQLVQRLGRQQGNAYVHRFLAARPVAIQRAGATTLDRPKSPPADLARAEAVTANKIAFVREEGLNLRVAPDQKSQSLTTLKFGQRVNALEDPNAASSWIKVVAQSQTGYAFAPRIHFPPADLIQKDPGLRLIKVPSGLSFWALVKQMYGIEGNESTKDQNMNHFINAIRAFNKDEAFDVRTDLLDDVGNFFLSGRDAKNTYLKANYDLWIPSFGVAAKMDVGSGTVRGEITRFIKEIEQKIEDFKEACRRSVPYMPEAITKRAGEVTSGLLHGLLEFAKDAVEILAVSTLVGALIGALFGGVGAIPGAEIGFEIGTLILEVYGLASLIDAILNIASDLVGQLGAFIKQVWNANGDTKQLDLAAHTLADAIGILVSAILVAFVAYVMKKGGEALGKTRFAKTVGETRLAEWLKDRQKLKTTRATVEPKPNPGPAPYTPPGSVGAMKRLEYEASPKHGTEARGTSKGVSNPAPRNGQAALDHSLQIKDTSPRRVGIDYEAGEFVVFDETHPNSGIYHGHVRTWDELTSQMQKTLIDAGMANRRGKILIGSEH